MLTEMFSSVVPQNLTNVKILNDFNSLTQKTIKLGKLKIKHVEPLLIFKVEFHITVLYLTIAFSVLIISAIVIKFRNKVVKMYSPKVPDNLSNNDQHES